MRHEFIVVEGLQLVVSKCGFLFCPCDVLEVLPSIAHVDFVGIQGVQNCHSFLLSIHLGIVDIILSLASLVNDSVPCMVGNGEPIFIIVREDLYQIFRMVSKAVVRFEDVIEPAGIVIGRSG